MAEDGIETTVINDSAVFAIMSRVNKVYKNIFVTVIVTGMIQHDLVGGGGVCALLALVREEGTCRVLEYRVLYIQMMQEIDDVMVTVTESQVSNRV